MHENQLQVTVAMVQELIDHQFPQWASHPVTRGMFDGTVNAIFRVGDQLAARFPLLPGDVEGTRQRLRAEAEAAHRLAQHTRLAVPEPVAIGDPGAGYPLPWSVQTWLAGTPASRLDLSGSYAFAEDLARLIRDIRSIDTDGQVFAGQGRGGELRAHDEWMDTCFERSTHLVDVPRLRGLWAELRDLPREAADAMTHGDLIGGNLLVSHGRLSGVIDVGGLGPADPALDLVSAWHLLESGPRRLLRAALRCGDLEWARSQAWALEQAMGAVWYYAETNESMSRMSHRTLERILADPLAS